MATTRTRPYADVPVDVKLVLCALWVAMLFVFAFVDILAFYRADVLHAALDGKVATTTFTVNQLFLSLSLAYILIPALMLVLSLLLKPRINRMTNLVVSVLYAISIVASAVGVHWAYYILGSIIEVMLLVVIAGTAWRWPQVEVGPEMTS